MPIAHFNAVRMASPATRVVVRTCVVMAVVLLAAAPAVGQGHSFSGTRGSSNEYRGKIDRAAAEQWAQLPLPVPPRTPGSAAPPVYPPVGGYSVGPSSPYTPPSTTSPIPPTPNLPSLLPPGSVDSHSTTWDPVPPATFPSPPLAPLDPNGGPAVVRPLSPSTTTAPGNASPTSTPTDLTPRYSFRFQNAPWTVVLRQCARDFGMSLDLRVTPAGALSYYDENTYTESQFLDILNDHLLREGCLLTRNGRNLTVAGANERIDDAAIPFITLPQIDGLGRNELVSVAFPYELMSEGTVQEMRQILSPMGRMRTLTNSRRVIVTDTGSYLRRIRDLLSGTGIGAGDIHTVVFRLRNAPAEEAAAAINNVLMSGAVGPIGPPPGPGGPGAPSIAAGGPQIVVAEKVTNRIFARGSSEELGVIERLICDIDSPPPQVFIQALLVEVQLGNTDEFGVEIGVQDSVLFQRSVIDNILTVTETITSPNGTQTSNQRIVSQTANPGFNFNNQPLGNNITASPATVGTQGLSSLGVGRVNGDLGFGGLVLSAGSESISVLLRALSERHHIDVLSRPQIRTLDNHEAIIQIGQQVPVVDGVAITGVGSANPVIRQDQAGIILRVMPRIGPDGLVLMTVNAEKSAFQLTPGTGVPIFTDATNGNVIEAPVKDVTSAETAVGARTGQTIVLGGMITRDNATVERKVPWLGDIPILGHAFRYDRVQSVRKELLIFLTPHIIDGQEHETKLKFDESSKIAMPWEDATQIHGPIFDDPALLPDSARVLPPGMPPVQGASDAMPTTENGIPVTARSTAPAAQSRLRGRSQRVQQANYERLSESTPPTPAPQPAATEADAAPAPAATPTTPSKPRTVLQPGQRPWKSWSPWKKQ